MRRLCPASLTIPRALVAVNVPSWNASALELVKPTKVDKARSPLVPWVWRCNPHGPPTTPALPCVNPLPSHGRHTERGRPAVLRRRRLYRALCRRGRRHSGQLDWRGVGRLGAGEARRLAQGPPVFHLQVSPPPSYTPAACPDRPAKARLQADRRCPRPPRSCAPRGPPRHRGASSRR